MMDRLEQLRRYVEPGALGVEIGPWFNPVAPRRLGYNTLIMDVYSTERLKETALIDPFIDNSMIDNIEDVDFVGPAHRLENFIGERGLLSSLDFVIASHTLEHFPDPISFLRSCERALKPGGILTLALPNRSNGFDYFRPNAQAGDMLQAYWEKREKPTPAQIYSHFSSLCFMRIDGVERHGWGPNDNVRDVYLHEDMFEALRVAESNAHDPNAPYHDTHCWCFTPPSFEMLFFELRLLGLLTLSLHELFAPQGHEFFVYLRNGQTGENLSDHADLNGERTRLRQAVVAYERNRLV